MFISDDNIKSINAISANLSSFQESMLNLQDDYSYLAGSYCTQG
jgi:hypothetical protein